jgi:hypothetical protein
LIKKTEMRQTIHAFFGFLGILLLGGCAASLPKVPAVTESTPLTPSEIAGPKGKFTETRARAVLQIYACPDGSNL